MPYKVTKGTGKRPWKIQKGGKTVGTSTSKKLAQASVRARHGITGGMAHK